MQSISEPKMRHIVAVANLMAETAERLGWPKADVEDAAVLGFVHDIGYLAQRTGHAAKGAEMLDRRGYDLAWEVENHGNLVDDPTPELALLWHADMSVNSMGDVVGYRRRLADIAFRYGGNSDARKRAEAIVRWLEENFPGIGKPESDEPDDVDEQLASQIVALETTCPTCERRMRVESIWRDDGMLKLQQRCPDCGHVQEETFDAI